MLLRIPHPFSIAIRIVILLTCFGSGFFGCSLASFKDAQDPDDLSQQEAFEGYEPQPRSRFQSNRQREVRTHVGDHDVQRGLEKGVLTHGMKTTEVLQLFGHPGSIEYAGEPRFGNQRWVYDNGVSDYWKLRSPKIVFFEGGRVSGWTGF